MDGFFVTSPHNSYYDNVKFVELKTPVITTQILYPRYYWCDVAHDALESIWLNDFKKFWFKLMKH